MKTPKPELQNSRILRLAMRVVLLPVALMAAILAGVKGLVRTGKSDKRLRSEDQQRQSRARRELRGLPPDHIQD